MHTCISESTEATFKEEIDVAFSVLSSKTSCNEKSDYRNLNSSKNWS